MNTIPNMPNGWPNKIGFTGPIDWNRHPSSPEMNRVYSKALILITATLTVYFAGCKSPAWEEVTTTWLDKFGELGGKAYEARSAWTYSVDGAGKPIIISIFACQIYLFIDGISPPSYWELSRKIRKGCNRGTNPAPKGSLF